MLHKASSIRLSFHSSLCEHGPACQNFGASASGVQLGRAGIVARRLVRAKEISRFCTCVARLTFCTCVARLTFCTCVARLTFCTCVARLTFCTCVG